MVGGNRESGEWSSLPQMEHMERERNHQSMTVLARYHNLLGSHTMKTLIKLTEEVRLAISFVSFIVVFVVSIVVVVIVVV